MFLNNVYHEAVTKHSTNELISMLSSELKNVRVDMRSNIKNNNMDELCLNVGRLDVIVSILGNLDDKLNSKKKQKVL